ncbi:LLM class flavin-dependent oxidoreductase [Citricoccus sp. NR2]|uniref:LLM class flavin-dependent oxidoreductase n=1 Tax=Citricoccus sp. NR2 TaxID=3004095 RepID=UPI0022DDC68A|nr:LLM class flavin-dependent oxidoreductase [Citricoccus sp. NR2]WBL20219.1 LLM class flavin-dependent oxidoreductase [Citricoccus sp. NR2]
MRARIVFPDPLSPITPTDSPALTADRLGYHTTLIPELYLNDRKGIHAPSLEAWALTSAVLAVTQNLRVMTAIRPGFHHLAVAAKQISTLDSIAPGRLALSTTPFSYDGDFFTLTDTIVEPKLSGELGIFAGGESEQGREAIAGFANAYAMHGGTVEEIREKITDMQRRRAAKNLPPLGEFAMSAYVIVRDTEAEAQAELERITTVDPDSPGYASFQEFTANSALDVEVSACEYAVGTRGLRPHLVGTAEQVAEKIRAYEEAGLTLLLIQSSPIEAELERIAAEVFPLVRRTPVTA